MEEELCRHQTRHEGVLDESARFSAIVVAGKVRQSAVLQRVLDAAALNQLLSQQRHHLRNVLGASLRPRVDHLDHAVVGRQGLDHLHVDVRGHRLQRRRDLVI